MIKINNLKKQFTKQTNNKKENVLIVALKLGHFGYIYGQNFN